MQVKTLLYVGPVRGRSVTGLGGRVADRGDHVVAVLGGDVVLLERELAAGGEGAALAGAVHDVVARLLFFHPDLRHRVAVALDDVLAGIVEDLVLGSVRQVDHRAGRRQQVGAGGLEVVVGPGPLARAELVMVLPAHGRDWAQRAGRVLDRALGTVGVRACRVGQDHRVLAVLVPEEVEDPLVLHQPGDEVEGGLAVLDAVFPLGEGALELERVVVEAEVAEDGLDDVRGVLVLEDPAVGGAGEEPGPGDDLGAVGPQLAAVEGPGDEPADEPAEVAGILVEPADAPGDRLADDVLGGDRVVLGGQVELVAEEARERLGAREAQQQEHVGAQGRVHRERAFCLGDRCHSHRPRLDRIVGTESSRLTQSWLTSVPRRLNRCHFERWSSTQQVLEPRLRLPPPEKAHAKWV